ncbi:unnamed protein product [Ambrosiozyma monospora]|uniref:Unnamed protein product n=1 Tax=Ambrosiozyma monospora TaxID=43982 RepID=A0ACB5UAT0_AMBMO|nr:unnamed protein product [Ambrosiozyma monospora]
MDGMDNRGQVIVIGATNRPDSVDPALRRPGRFDREFFFPLPDLKSREEILNIHMRKWENKLNPEFVKELAKLTKGYGGADLRALCTESALNSIQRAYPQIYKSNDKLKINVNKIKVNPSDFTRALNKIIPSSARSTSLSAAPLPEHVEPLLKAQFKTVKDKLEDIIPSKKQPNILEESEYVDLSLLREDGGFKHQQMLTRLKQLRVFKPRLLISGKLGFGQGYIANAILHSLEGFNIQILDFAKLHSDSTISPESIIIQMFQELRRHKPSVLYIPDLLSFMQNITPSIKATITNMTRNMSPNDQLVRLKNFSSLHLIQSR